MRNFRCMVILTTTACQLRCKNCAVDSWMRKNTGFCTSLNQVRKMIDCSIASGYHFEYVNLVGGEPLLWKNLVPALRLINESHVSDNVSIITNLMWFDETKIELMREIASMIDIIVVSKYPPNKERCELLLKSRIVGRNGSVEIKEENFIRQPTKPTGGTLPARCGCVAMELFGDTVNACVGMRFISDSLGLEIEPRFTTDMGVGYAERLDLKNVFTSDMCKLCVSNKNVSSVLGGEPWKDGRDEKGQIDG